MSNYQAELAELIKKKIDIAIAFHFEVESCLSELMEKYGDELESEQELILSTLSALNDVSVYVAQRKDIGDTFRDEILAGIGTATKSMLNGL